MIIIRCYMPCPFWDQWVVVDAIAKGAGPANWTWLWSHENEHRLAIPRLLVWLDLFAAGGKNISLFAEIVFVQLLHLGAICFVIERFTSLPVHIKRLLEGLFAFALFHPDQIENFTWAFQIGFVLPFALATLAFILIVFLPHFKRPSLAVTVSALIPLVAALNLSAGLLIGPIIIGVSHLKQISFRLTITLYVSCFVTWFLYLYGYHQSGTDLTFVQALGRTKELFVYVLTYFGASWTRLMPHKERIIAFISLVVFTAIMTRLVRRPSELSEFEWILTAECLLAFATALLTAFGRIQFGVGQAFASRYQTPAMLYWAALAALTIVWFYRHWPKRIAFAEALLVVLILPSVLTFPRMWHSAVARADNLRSACQNVMGAHIDVREAKKLYGNTTIILESRPFLIEIWTAPQLQEKKLNTSSRQPVR